MSRERVMWRQLEAEERAVERLAVGSAGGAHAAGAGPLGGGRCKLESAAWFREFTLTKRNQLSS